MTDGDTEGAAPQPEPKQVQPQMKVLGQFVRDLSFENVMAQKGISGEVQPDVSVQVNMDAKKRAAENQFEVSVKLSVDSKAKAGGEQMFLLELEYTGIFHIENVPDPQLHPFLLIECPRMLFPFIRRIVSDVTRDGGYPPLNLENIDFVAIYRNQIARMQAAQNAKPNGDAAGDASTDADADA